MNTWTNDFKTLSADLHLDLMLIFDFMKSNKLRETAFQITHYMKETNFFQR